MNYKWKLNSQTDFLGMVTLQEQAGPFYYCSFEPAAAFEALRPHFEQMHVLAADESCSIEECYEYYMAHIAVIRPVLVPLEDTPEAPSPPMIHIEGNDLWFRILR